MKLYVGCSSYTSVDSSATISFSILQLADCLHDFSRQLDDYLVAQEVLIIYQHLRNTPTPIQVPYRIPAQPLLPLPHCNNVVSPNLLLSWVI